MSRSIFGLIAALAAAISLCGASSSAHADSEILGELVLKPASRVEKNAGVWVDGRYLGYLKELKGKNKILLLPGEHDVTLRLAGYLDLETTVELEAGERATYRMAMQQDPTARYPDKSETGRVRLSVQPERAAVFVNGKYAGHVDEFDGSRGLRVSAGKHSFKITLPGYHPFETELTVMAQQDYEIKTELRRK